MCRGVTGPLLVSVSRVPALTIQGTEEGRLCTCAISVHLKPGQADNEDHDDRAG